jgi:hypothetical protein
VLEDEEEEDEVLKQDFKKMKKRLNYLTVFLTIVTILMIFNIAFQFNNFTTKGAIINAGDGIKLEIESVEDNYIVHNVKVLLKNTGDTTARLSVSGEVLISAMESAYGEEVTAILDYKYLELRPGESKDLNLGTFTEFENWHYVIKVHISWNGGSSELGQLLIPEI